MRSLETDIVMDPDLVRRYDARGPRYTSYPTADRFVEAFDAACYRHWLKNRAIGGLSKPLGLYVHLPFCDTLCYYCACNKVVTRDHGRAAQYLDYLDREMALLCDNLGESTLNSVHWGGGTPNFLSDSELEALDARIRSRFRIERDAEQSIEVDPRKLGSSTITLLAGLGFNRISIGVQDFDPDVQRAVNRVQSREQTWRALEQARRHGFHSVNFDLIYGLPLQTLAGFDRTLDTVLECWPDRIALYNYAHLPEIFKAQRRIAENELPDPDTKLKLLARAIERLGGAGYVYIGMDHFARPEDDLAQALRQGRLTRNFQGYSTSGDSDIAGIGVSAISKIGPAYSQNAKEPEDYCDRVDHGVLPVLRGVELSPDDLVRRAVIQSLMCHFDVSMEAIGIAYLIDFRRYFAAELEDLQPLAADGLVELHNDWITVTPRGRLLVRSVCMIFDRYLRERRQREQGEATVRKLRYSRVI